MISNGKIVFPIEKSFKKLKFSLSILVCLILLFCKLLQKESRRAIITQVKCNYAKKYEKNSNLFIPKIGFAHHWVMGTNFVAFYLMTFTLSKIDDDGKP